MPDPVVLAAFTLASIALVVVPGPNLIFILTRTMAQGTRAGLASAAGVETATLIYVVATVLGVSGLIAQSEVTFMALRYAGAAYLGYLAVQTFRHPPTVGMSEDHSTPRFSRIYRDGAIVNLLNPKVALFFLAFLPQFVDPAATAAPATAQLLVLGLVFLLIALLLDLGSAFAGGAATSLIRRRGSQITWIRWPVVAVYLGLAGYALVA